MLFYSMFRVSYPFFLGALPGVYVDVHGAYKLSEKFAKPYFHKYCTEIYDVTTI